MSFQSNHRAGLSASRYVKGLLATKGSDGRISAERGSSERDRLGTIQIGFTALEYLMFLYMNHHIKVATRSSRLSSLSLAGDSQAGASVDASRYFDFHRAFTLYSAGASALATRVPDDFARSSAR